MQIRRARHGDISAIAALESECFTRGAAADVLERMLEGDSVVLVAETAGEMLGYGYFQFVLDEGYVGNIAVRPEHRRRGIGLALTEAMADEARALGLAFLTLEVRESNLAARRLYERCGYRLAGLRKNYYEKPTENAILMTKTFL